MKILHRPSGNEKGEQRTISPEMFMYISLLSLAVFVTLHLMALKAV